MKKTQENILDDQQRKIIRQLIKDPRISDNKLAKKTAIPVMSVNRKRKALEDTGIIQYYTKVNYSEQGLDIFPIMQLFILKFKTGITQKDYVKNVEYDVHHRIFTTQIISDSYLGQRDGHLALCLILQANSTSQMNEEFHGKIIPHLEQKLGKNCVETVDAIWLSQQIRAHHNYFPFINTIGAKMKQDWPEQYIFVDEHFLDNLSPFLDDDQSEK